MHRFLLIKDAAVIATIDRERSVIRGGSIYIEGSEIKAIGPSSEVDFKADRVIDARGMLVLPGLINTHHHLFQTMWRNVPIVQDAKLFEWLLELYEIWREISRDAIYTSAKVGLAELLLSGCTLSSDMLYIFPQDDTGMIDEEITAARELGMRFHPCRGSMSLGRSEGGLPPDDITQGDSEIMGYYENLIREHHDTSRYAMTRIALGPCSPFSVTPDLMIKTRELAKRYKVRCHTHLAETLDEEEFCIEKTGMRPLAFMESLGWLGEDVWYAHGIHFNEEEIKLLAETGTGVAHCPLSNMRLGSGVAPVPQMLEAGVNVGLAVDGSASNDSGNMLAELRTAMLLARSKYGVGCMSATQAIELATLGGARLMGWEDELGSLEVGKAADLVCIDLKRLAFAGALHDPVAAIAFCDAQRVDYSVINGRVVVDDGQIDGLDVPALIEKQNELAEDMVGQAEARTGKSFREKEWRRAFR